MHAAASFSRRPRRGSRLRAAADAQLYVGFGAGVGTLNMSGQD